MFKQLLHENKIDQIQKYVRPLLENPCTFCQKSGLDKAKVWRVFLGICDPAHLFIYLAELNK